MSVLSLWHLVYTTFLFVWDVSVYRGKYFPESICMFVFIVTETKLCCSQNNSTSRCAEAWGKLIRADGSGAGDEHSVIMQ